MIDTDATIALASVDVDYRNRLDPADIVSMLTTLWKRRVARPTTLDAKGISARLT